MSTITIQGKRRINATMPVHGAKNSALPILAASIVQRGQSVIHNCPRLSDVDASIRIMEHLGCTITREGSTVVVDSTNLEPRPIPHELMREMRSSIIFLGAMLARLGKAEVSLPGGCEIGLRPIDLHLKALKQMGANVDDSHGTLQCDVGEGLKGAQIALAIPSVGATENIMLAACTAQGVTTITNAAREPEISDMADFLNACGGRICGAGEGTIEIEGVKRLFGCQHTIIPDRITASTYMCAAAVTGGKVLLPHIIPAHLEPVLPVFEEAGCDIQVGGDYLKLTAPPRLKAVKAIRTMYYPGFPTDAQAPVMSMLTIADGNSMFVENIFENRYMHVGELCRMGANIKIEGRVAVVEGVKTLWGTAVEAGDLRGAAALIIAGLCAEGKTVVSGLHHLDRGYENLVDVLTQAGASLQRKEE